jgi:hypothetical protein
MRTNAELIPLPQASYRETPSEQRHEPEAFADNLTKAEASKRIDALKAKPGR